MEYSLLFIVRFVMSLNLQSLRIIRFKDTSYTLCDRKTSIQSFYHILRLQTVQSKMRSCTMSLFACLYIQSYYVMLSKCKQIELRSIDEKIELQPTILKAITCLNSTFVVLMYSNVSEPGRWSGENFDSNQSVDLNIHDIHDLSSKQVRAQRSLTDSTKRYI